MDQMESGSQEVRRVGVLSVARVSAAIGLFWGIIFVVILIAGASAGGGNQFGVLAAVVIGQAVLMGFIAGAISAAVYNLVAGSVGGIRVELV